ncbi:protein delta homolog 2 [Betta splendens]|uniref:Protein delta homolog 2 n=1 Tax=Betta splendens TaxID=158456 RepID=A0A6P7KQ02_BETSP|nr:protein delta homolog 2 [Betta splendens]XP_028983551.1 protein delta homolog 2 [Betta splendens]XP_040923493.1 protein delta homolog 2 [Betta splendens]XP_040923494.1 protein delta homolog 2 [Betta splendens]XP_055358796.1 protein delta homolog 2 [Betta splendens]XP_055358797.1 protein delta homolog 2 [Betta splendens]XP_055358798.1 protein delta homolog 2 [Betta splendens]XP_055358799.1 protein delta homolog 2 [Betta splendens]XP_055358800.1 protein delta homolog 2 [Betta splendens]XP
MLPPSCWVLLILTVPSCTGQESSCSCNITNSRCDEFGVCRCDPGWDGELCERCVPKPGCLHGSCQQPWQCSCDPGWAGRFCDKDLMVCAAQQPCQHGATCVVEASGEYACVCPEGFHGRNCQLKAGPCHQRRSPCKNGALCEDADGFAAELTCRCLAGFTGSHCETNMDDCLMKPCANGAICLDGVNRFSCLCPSGFTGRFCTVNVDECASRPCLHAGRCLDRAGGFHCVCQPGFAGSTCQTLLGGVGSNLTTRVKPHRTTSNSSRHGNQLFKVTVSERSASQLSRVQLIVLLVLAGLTLGAVALTASFVLQGHCSRCLSASQRGQKSSQRTDQDACQINFLNAAEPENNKVNTKVMLTERRSST